MTSSTARVCAPFKYRNFRILFGAELIQRSGSYVSFTAISLSLGAQEENTALLLGLLGLCVTGPSLVLAPLAGYFIKEESRQSVLRAAQLWFAFANAVCAALSTDPLASPFVLLFGALLFGMGLAVTATTLSAFMRDVIRKEEDLAAANSVSWATLNLVVLLGGVAGGFVYTGLGSSACFTCAAAANLFAFFLLLNLEMTPPSDPGLKPKPTSRDAVLGFVWIVIAFEALTSFAANPYLFQLPAINQHLTAGEPFGYSLLLVVGACGGISGGLSLSVFKPTSALSFMTSCLACIGVSLIALSFANDLITAAMAIFALNFAIASLMVSETTFLQTHTREADRGRVMGFFMMAHIGVLPIGSFVLYGLLGEQVGTLRVFGVCGSIFIVTSLFSRLAFQRWVSYGRSSL